MCCLTARAQQTEEMRQLPILEATAKNFEPYGQNVFPSAGKILLQDEGSEVFFFRKVELHPLQTEPESG
jgi:hypothetical protein